MDAHINDDIHILEEGNSTRILGAHIGNHIDSAGVWARQMEKIIVALDRWDRTHPTLQGKAHIVRMVVGGMSQYLTAVQGSPAKVTKSLHKIIRNFFWGTSAPPPVAEKYLFAPLSKGGWNLLNITARNNAIKLMKLKKLTDYGPQRPLWADAATALILAHIPKTEWCRGDSLSMKSLFLQDIFKRSNYRSLQPARGTYIDP